MIFDLNPENFEYDRINKKVFLNHFFYYDEKSNEPRLWWAGFILILVLGFPLFIFAFIWIERKWNENKDVYMKKINELKKKG